ncbi:M23 family metallopeptidase [Streptomyces sp. JNUCC 64]
MPDNPTSPTDPIRPASSTNSPTGPSSPAAGTVSTPSAPGARRTRDALHKGLGIAYRVLWLTLAALIVAGQLYAPLSQGLFPLLWLAQGVATVCVLGLLRLTRPERGAPVLPDPVEVDPPVTGRWTAFNSPADKVPSHGTHAYAQTYAIDVVADPEPRRVAGRPTGPVRPPFAWFWPLVRRPEAHPAHGAPLLAVADATVVRVSDGQRDHLTRSSPPMLGYLLLIEGAVRSVAGSRRVLGNHLVLDLGDGVHALYCHLLRGSPTVREGDRVRSGQTLAACGNSGNSTEPHLHFQLMDGPDPDTARGLPFRWRGVGLPANGESFTVPDGAVPDGAVPDGAVPDERVPGEPVPDGVPAPEESVPGGK